MGDVVRRDHGPEPVFRERMRPPSWCWLATVAGLTLVGRLSGFGDGWPDVAGVAAVVTLLLGLYASAIVLEVRDGAIVTARRAGGRRLPVTDIVDTRALTGRALREVRNRLTPSFRLHCPIWYRRGLQIVTLDADGERVEHLYGLHDAPGFLRAIGTPEGSVAHHDRRGVPV